MGGGLMQLVAYGAQDIYLTGNPQITFFKVVYRRHTNFSMESIQQTFSGSGKSVVATISRNGDLVHKMYLCQSASATLITFPTITTVELEIGGQRIDRHSGQWMRTWNELSTSESKAIGLKAMTGEIGTITADNNNTGVDLVHIPLLFWFCRNPGLALPLIALQYHEVKVKFDLAENQSTTKFELYCDYIYLDTDERRRFAQVSHEYLIEQVQEQSTASTASNKLNFNHPVKELIWTTAPENQPTSVGLKLNGHDRFSTRGSDYFYLQQPFDYHTAVPRQNLPLAARQTLFFGDGLASISRASTLVGGSGPGAVVNYDSNGLTLEETDGGTLVTDVQDLDDSLTSKTELIGQTLLITVLSVISEGVGGSGGSVPGSTFTAQVSSVGDPGEDNILTFVAEPSDKDGNKFTVAGANGDFADGDTISISILKGTGSINSARTSQDTQPIGVYSFALKPEEHQPSGTCNFSRIDNAELTLTGPTATTGKIFAVNYNVLRIMSGMGGLAYSN